MRILGQLDAGAFVQRRIPLIGFSDCTALHAWAACQGVPTIHGPVVTQLSKLPKKDIEALFGLLTGKSSPQLHGLKSLRPGQCAGKVFGGNLSVLAHLVGTPFFPNLTGQILLIEETNEAHYRLDRLLTQLILAGHLNKIVGVFVGTLHQCHGVKNKLLSHALDVIIERLWPLNLPMVAEAPVGHGDRNLALPLGIAATLNADAGTVIFSHPQVATSPSTGGEP